MQDASYKMKCNVNNVGLTIRFHESTTEITVISMHETRRSKQM